MGTEKNCSSAARNRRRIDSEAVTLEAAGWRSTPIAKLGDDLLVEILIRSFPDPKSASRCKSVCKRWSTLISDPIRFNRRFVSHRQSITNQNHPPLFFPSPPDDAVPILLNSLPTPAEKPGLDFEVLDSFKDLVLCGVVYRVFPRELTRSYFLCNPFTNQWVALPLAPELPLTSSATFVRLVCEPRIANNNLDLGDDGEAAVEYCSQYRFCVARQYRDRKDIKLDVFRSDSGEWTKDVLVLHNHRYHRNYEQLKTDAAVSCNGELFWPYSVPNSPTSSSLGLKTLIAAYNPFCPDGVPPATIDVPQVPGKWDWDISVSQGALHVVLFERGFGHRPAGEDDHRRLRRSIVWRLKDDRKSWRKVCEGLVKPSRLYDDDPEKCHLLCLHPEKPEVVFFKHRERGRESTILSCHLRSSSSTATTCGELEFFAIPRRFMTTRSRVVQAKVPCWPTSIPNYEKLRVMYNGSYSCWVQSNNIAATSSYLNN